LQVVDIMNFSLWDNAVHEDGEQLKRIATAKKADTTPASIDRENKTAVFKGSGKEPYITTLESCSCRDFFVRKLPCKHIYRLALELEGADVKQGINKNEYAELPCDIFALPAESQSILYEMCVSKIYHGDNIFAFERDEFSEALFYNGFCVQSVPTLETVSALPLPSIKRIIHASCPDMEGLPKKSAQTKSVIAWVSANIESIIPLIDKRFMFLEFTEHADKHKVTIHRRLAKIYGSSTPRDEDFVVKFRIL